MRTESTKLVGRIGDDYYFVDSVFRHNDGFSGVTGFVVRPVSTDEWEWASDEENVAERLQDYYSDQFGYTKESAFMAWVRKAINTDGIEHIMFDNSFKSEASSAFDDLGIENVCTDCSGCGRIFGRFGGSDPVVFDEVFDSAAYEAAIAYEDGIISYDNAVSAIFG